MAGMATTPILPNLPAIQVVKLAASSVFRNHITHTHLLTEELPGLFAAAL